MNSRTLEQAEITSLYSDWIIQQDTRESLLSHYLLYWDRIYFNNYVPYFSYPQVFHRNIQHGGISYSAQLFESQKGEWETGLEQSSRISLSFRSWINSAGKAQGVVLVKAALYKEII